MHKWICYTTGVSTNGYGIKLMPTPKVNSWLGWWIFTINSRRRCFGYFGGGALETTDLGSGMTVHSSVHSHFYGFKSTVRRQKVRQCHSRSRFWISHLMHFRIKLLIWIREYSIWNHPLPRSYQYLKNHTRSNGATTRVLKYTQLDTWRTTLPWIKILRSRSTLPQNNF
jgi:hypothetical protein